MLGTPIHVWAVFAVTTAAALLIDLGVFHRKNHIIGLREALLESAAWISVSLLFNLWLYHSQGPQVGVEFLTGYLVEKSLSVDNIFVSGSARRPGDARGLRTGGHRVAAIVSRGAVRFRGAAAVDRLEDVLSGQTRDAAGSESASAGGAADHSGERSVRGRALLCAASRKMDCHAALLGAGSRRGHGHQFRGRLSARGARDHEQRVHCLFLKRIRDFGFACAVFRVGGPAAAFSLLASGARGDSGSCWCEDDSERVVAGVRAGFPRGYRGGSGGNRGRVFVVSSGR